MIDQLTASRRMLLTTTATEEDLSSAVAEVLDLGADALTQALMSRCVNCCAVFRDGTPGFTTHGDPRLREALRGCNATLDILLRYKVEKVWGQSAGAPPRIPQDARWPRLAEERLVSLLELDLEELFTLTDLLVRSCGAYRGEDGRPLPLPVLGDNRHAG